jgi:hypothetical protein
MMHKHRRWCVSEVESPEELARKLTSATWTLCTGFSVRGHPQYVFLNDSTHEDAAMEFAVVKRRIDAAEHLQIESITFSWADEGRSLHYIREALSGAWDGVDFAVPVEPKLETAAEHGRCHLCA